MDTENAKTLQYSPDNGSTWMGPFSQQEIDQLKAAGTVEDSYLIKDTAVQDIVPVENVDSPASEAPNVARANVPPPIEAVPNPVPSFPVDADYYVNLSGEQKGPYNINELRKLVANHTVHHATMCWTQGMENWKAISDVLPELFAQGSGEKLEKLEGFFITRFFADVFKRHQPNETVDLFCCGSSRTTPPLHEVPTNWPSPWIFARMLAICLLLYFGFDWGWSEFHRNPTLLTGSFFVGNFGIPFCVTILFFELNVRRDVPFLKVARAMVVGGLISLIVALFLFENVNLGRDAYWAGPIEEPAKLIATLIVASRLRNGRILTGMLLGCAVGAGFAAFESGGYTLRGGLDTMEMRALLSPFGHVVWTAITAGAYWFVQNLKTESAQRKPEDKRIDFSILADMRFLRIALFPVAIHMVWNSELLPTLGYWKYVGLGVIAWIIALRLIQAGLNQVRAEQIKAKPSNIA